MSSTNTTVLKPLAPKVNQQNRKNSSKEPLAQNSENVTSTTHGPIRGGTKRKAFHPTLGYAIPPPVPAKVMRKMLVNAIELNRSIVGLKCSVLTFRPLSNTKRCQK